MTVPIVRRFALSWRMKVTRLHLCQDLVGHCEPSDNQFDLVIADIFLHHSSGLKLFKIIQRLNKNIPFIGMAAFPGQNLSFIAEAILKECFFVKPFSFQDLKKKINTVLAKA
jgi:DNA-binding NtrC family response regulator